MSRSVEIAIQTEIHRKPALFSPSFRTRSFWLVNAVLAISGVTLVWPSAVQLLKTGHTDVHWSRFVIAISCFNFAANLLVFRIVSVLLALLGSRAHYLASTCIEIGGPAGERVQVASFRAGKPA